MYKVCMYVYIIIIYCIYIFYAYIYTHIYIYRCDMYVYWLNQHVWSTYKHVYIYIYMYIYISIWLHARFGVSQHACFYTDPGKSTLNREVLSCKAARSSAYNEGKIIINHQFGNGWYHVSTYLWWNWRWFIIVLQRLMYMTWIFDIYNYNSE